jgi:hypothetical protein
MYLGVVDVCADGRAESFDAIDSVSQGRTSETLDQFKEPRAHQVQEARNLCEEFDSGKLGSLINFHGRPIGEAIKGTCLPSLS